MILNRPGYEVGHQIRGHPLGVINDKIDRARGLFLSPLRQMSPTGLLVNFSVGSGHSDG